MSIKVQIKEKEYIKLNLIIIFKKPLLIIIFSIICLSSFLRFISESDHSILHLLPLVLVPLVLSFSIIRSSRKAFRTYQLLQEEIEYNFDDDAITITGETFNSKLGWSKLYKVLKLKDWILLYQNRSLFNMIPMRVLSTIDISNLKTILNKNSVKNNL